LQWESVDPDPNVITIKKANTISAREIDGRTKLVTNYQAKAYYTVPALLHTCYISRKIALETYRPRFEKHLSHPVYFDFSKDILNVEECDALASFLRTPWFADLKIDLEEANQIRFLSFAEEWYLYQDRILQRLHRFEGLRNIYFERASGEKAGLLSHFEWSLRMKWQTWRTWKTVGPGCSIDIPDINFLERVHFRKLIKSQAM
jgi:hypothetical protein